MVVKTLEVPGLSIQNFVDASHLEDALSRNAHLPRTLHLTEDATIEEATMYGVHLPIGSELGLTLKGFPPVVVGFGGPLAGRLHQGMVVKELSIPSRSIHMSLATGGFTSLRVDQALQQNWDAADRQLVVAFTPPPVAERRPCMAWDVGSFRNQSRWTLARMLSSKRVGAVSNTDAYPTAEELKQAERQVLKLKNGEIL